MWRRGFQTGASTANNIVSTSCSGGCSRFRRKPKNAFRCFSPPSSSEVHPISSHLSSRFMTTDGQQSSHDTSMIKSATSESEASPIGSIYNPPPYTIEPEGIANSIRCSLVGASMSHAETSRDTGMSLAFLGTGAGLPTKGRCPTSTLVKLGGESFLVDAGEGVQRQLTFTRAKPSHIDRIFITHLHGDHIFGLPGLLLGLQHSQQHQHHEMSSSTPSPNHKIYSNKGRIKKRSMQRVEERVVKIYGPPGLYNYIAANIILSCTLIHSLNIEVYELVGGRVRRAHGSRDIRNPFEASYPEFNFGRLTRHQIQCNPDGVWVIQDLPPLVTREAILSKTSSSPRNSNVDSSASNGRRFRIQAAEVDHLSGVATFGYTIQEEEPPRNIDATKAKALGVSHVCHKYNLLKAGFSVWNDDGTQEVQPHQVLTTRRKKARKIALVGDNRGWTPSMKRIARDSDILVHEATLMDKDTDWRKRGHSTADMAGRISGEINAKLLILNHISPKADYFNREEDGQSAQLTLIQDAKEASNQISKVIVAYDFMEVLVPWLGFGSLPEEEEEDADSPPINAVRKSASNAVDGQKVDTKQVLKDWFGASNNP